MRKRSTTVYVDRMRTEQEIVAHVVDQGSDPKYLTQSWDDISNRPAKHHRKVKITVTVETVK